MKYCNLVLFSLVFCLASSCKKKSTDSTPTPPPGGGTTVDTTSNLRIMTYNIHHANPPSTTTIDINAIASVINNQQPHLVALQEVDVYTSRSGTTLHQANQLGILTNMKVYFGKAINYGGGEYGVAILSKFALSDMKNRPLPTADGTGGEIRTMASAVITLGNGKKLVFASTHLDAQSSDTNRYLQINKIMEFLNQETLPVILAGDFNAVPGTRIIDTLDASFKRTCITNCGFTIPVLNPTKTIDFIAYKPTDKFTVLEHRVIDQVYASDHLPVFSVVRIK